jgi:hypothetical protein
MRYLRNHLTRRANHRHDSTIAQFCRTAQRMPEKRAGMAMADLATKIGARYSAHDTLLLRRIQNDLRRKIMNAYTLTRPLAADLLDADTADKLGWIAWRLLPAQCHSSIPGG